MRRLEHTLQDNAVLPWVTLQGLGAPSQVARGMRRWSTCGRHASPPPSPSPSPSPLILQRPWSEALPTPPESWAAAVCGDVGFAGLASATAGRGDLSTSGTPEACPPSPLSVGVRSSLVDSDAWYMQLCQRRQRVARVRSIAATGRDSYSHLLPGNSRSTSASSPQLLATPAYSTASSSMDGSKASAVEAAPPTGDASSAPPSCESSALWVWMGGDSSSSKSGGEHSARNRPCGDGKAGSGRVMFYSGQTGAVHASTVQAVADSSGVGLAGLAGRAQRGAAKSGDTAPFWLDVAGATARELHELADLFGLHPLTVEDIEQGCSRDKLDVFGDYLFVVYHTVGSRRRDEGQSYCHYGQSSGSIGPAASGEWGAGCSDSDGDDGGGPICIVLKRNAVLTFHRRGLQPAVERVAARLAAIGAAAAEAAGDDEMLGRLAEYPAYIVYAILDEATDRLGPEIAEIERQVDALDELVLALTHDEHESALRHMGEQRRRILQMWQLAQPKAVVVAALGKALGAGGRQPSVVSLLADAALAAEVVQYLADVHEHVAAATAACARAEAVLARSHSNYLARISLELSRASLDTNSTTERWTLLGAIVVPINVVTSFLGVNLKVPGQDRDDTLNFFLVLACMAIYAGVTLAFWRRRRLV